MRRPETTGAGFAGADRRPRVPGSRVAAVAMAVALAVGFLARTAGAQESVFGLTFLGTSEESGDERARGMGLLGVGLDDPKTALALNPAGLASLPYMTISGMAVVGRRTSRDGSDELHASLARLPHQRFALPILGNKVVLSTGFLGLSNSSGKFKLPDRYLGTDSTAQRFERSGTLYTIPVAIAGKVGARLRLGISLDFLLGTVNEAWTTGSDSLVTLTTRRRDEFAGRSVTFGVVGYPLPQLRLGASWNPAFDSDRDTRTTLEDIRIPGGTPLRTTSEHAVARLPQCLRAGGAYQLGTRLLLGADYLWRDWGQYRGRLYGASSVGTESRLGGGLEWRPPHRRLVYRGGVSRHVLPQLLGDHTVNETTLHLGTGFDFTEGAGRLDMGFEYAWIGNLDRNGLVERSWRFVASISGQELWKRKSPRK